MKKAPGIQFSKAKVTKSTPVGLKDDSLQKTSKKKSALKQKGDSLDSPPSYSKLQGATAEPQPGNQGDPPSYTQAVGDNQSKPYSEVPPPPLPPPGSIPASTSLKSESAAVPPPPPGPPGVAKSAKYRTKASGGHATDLYSETAAEELSFKSKSAAAPPPPPGPPPGVAKAPKYPTKTAGGHATDLHFETVAEELSPADLPALCRHLGITSTKMEQIQYDNRHLPFQEQVIAILQEWRKKAGREVTLKALLQALANSGNVMVANIIEDKLQIKGDTPQQAKGQDYLTDLVDMRTLEERLDDDGHEMYARTMSELKKTFKPKDRATGESDPAAKLKYFCPKCNQGYSNVTLLNLHVDDCIEHVETRNKVKIQMSMEAVDELEFFHDTRSSLSNSEHISTIDDALIREIAYGCQEGDWQQLAYHLGFMEHAINRFEVRQPSNTPQEHAEVLLKDWRRRQKQRTDMVLKVAVALRKCKKIHLITIADKIEKRHQAAQFRSTKTPQTKERDSAISSGIGSSMGTTIDEDTLQQLSSQLGRDWKKLAAHLGYSQRARNRLENRQPDYNSQEQALYMLKEWMRRQTPGTDVVGTICKNLQKCGERHLAELAEWLRKQSSAAAAAASPESPATLSSGLFSPKTPTGGVKSRSGSHIMISYQWDSQKRAMELKRQLFKAGYNVWMDVDKMGGDLLGSMADAVENAAVVILCVSQKYKESSNCRGEASYAFQLKKPIIPVIVEKGYQPDGWLGMVISMRLYYRMYNDEVMKDDLPALINDIGDSGRTYQHSASFSSKATPSSIDSFDLKNKCKAYVYLCDPQHELLPYADVWVTMFLNPSLRIFKDEVNQHLLAAGGDPLHKSLKAIFGTTKPPLSVGTVLQTTPGNLPCQKAFHIIYKENVHSSGYVTELRAAFSECLYLAQHRGASSIAFSLFTPQQTFEFKTVVEQLVSCVLNELKEKDQGSLRRLLFVTQNTSITKKISSELYHVVSLQNAQPALWKNTLNNGTVVRVSRGNVKYVASDALIISINPRYQRIGLSAAIYKKGGPSLQAEFDKYTKTTVHSPGTAFKLTNGNLPCGRVIYAVVPSASSTPKDTRKELLGKSVISSLKIADAENCKTVSIPSIGSSYGHFRPDEGAQIIVDSVLQYFKDNPSSSITEFQFMDTNPRTCSILKDALTARLGKESIQVQEELPDGSADGNRDTEIEIEETPAEILARGPAAHQAYLEASREGTKAVYRTRLMLVGQERVGKTSLMKNLSGQRFDMTESITDGVDATTLCKVPEDIAKPWKLQDSAIQDFANYVQSQYMDTLCTLMAQRLTELGEREEHIDSADEEQEKEELLELLSQMKDLQAQESQPEEVPPDETDGAPAEDDVQKDDDLEVDSAPLTDEESEDDEQRIAQETPEVAAAPVDAKPPASVPDAILKKLQQVLREKKQELQAAEAKKGVQEFQIWDFAGQDVYYTTHQVFLSNRALYMVVFDLCADLNKPVKVEVFHNDKVQSRFHDFTGLGFLDFWMQSIYAYATTNQPIPSEDKPQLSPPIFIIGTHRESGNLSQDPEERKSIVSDKFQSISDMIAGKPYEQHVVSKYFAIENSSNDQADAELMELRHQIASIASQESYMGEKIPLRWLTFEKSVAEAITQCKHYMSLQQVRDLTKELGVTDDRELYTMLQFYHDLGTIIYFGGEDKANQFLQDMVILNPQWLIDIFKRIITVMPHQKQWATQKNKWRRLKEEGILEDSLIDHMWSDLLPQKPALLTLMEMFDLLCPRLEAQEEDTLTYYVPACLQPCSEEEVKQELEASGKPVTFYIDFQGFLPDGLFHRLLVHSARWSQQQSGEEPQLYFRYGSFTLDDEHNFQLEMKGADPICIKVTICKVLVLSPDGVQDNSNIEDHPCPKACSMVRTFLTHALNELTYTWIRGVKYEFSVACPCNDLQSHTPEADLPKCFHLLQLEDCLVKAKIKCKGKKMWVATEIFKKWFHRKDDEEDEDEIAVLKRGIRALSDVELLELAGEIGTSWKKLGLYLGLRACHIAMLNCDHPLTEDKAFHMLIHWHEKLSQKDNARAMLSKALKKCGLVSLSEFYENPKDAE
ncbi:uncharacterized protein [Amphiura filiformis]|uniref:uncharacterized protein isoform X2 n=1 Tax=Amphiura filiformis TaxID=82378 RepID=UPI003B22619B